jgi:hypothetical protein
LKLTDQSIFFFFPLEFLLPPEFPFSCGFSLFQYKNIWNTIAKLRNAARM